MPAASRIYKCPHLLGNERVNQGARVVRPFKFDQNPHTKSEESRKYLNDLRRRELSNQILPKRPDQLPAKQQERLQELFSVYAEQSARSFRPAADALPKLALCSNQLLRQDEHRFKGKNLKDVATALPPLIFTPKSTRNNSLPTKNLGLQLPNIVEQN